ncbi:hypothetical protein LMG24238_00512 [Paraburkholderia sediminicola]|uniref:Conserved hypothetical protein CHP03032 domain-containing protein n=1 Tax=Paraburkholderia sediminicola TaxID=458836 RepID=A0A6J4ZV54_9BURK|nr:TIGR03032 family protein [Paraburkholderia sediminicola]CAB3643661.1 hypothetical protein LMG24238_00512 [Paraburkholderia sediminicola]
MEAAELKDEVQGNGIAEKPDLIDLRDTGRFLATLEALNCSLALSRRPSGVALLGVDKGVPTLSACMLPRSMGLAVEGDRLAIATHREVIVFANAKAIAQQYPARPNHYDGVFVPRVAHFTGNCDLHDMALDGPRVIAVNTRFSCLCVIDGFFNFTPFWRPPFLTDFTGDDRCHLNGMAFHDRKASFATALGHTNTSYGWREGMADGGIVMEVPSGRIVASGLSMPHSPRVIDGQLYVLEGGRGHVLQIDTTTGTKRVVAELPGFTHGLAVYGGVLFVGLSKLRMKRGPQGLPIESRGELVAGVAAIELASGQVLGILEFYNGVEEIFDVQVLPNVRRAEILAPHQWFETPSIETVHGGMWELRDDEGDNA